MPFKSRAQRRKFAQLLIEGKISDETFEEWNRETGGKHLPERVTPRATRRTRAKKKTRAKARKASTKKARKTIRRARKSAPARKR
jgi:MoxR-like ATPase